MEKLEEQNVKLKQRNRRLKYQLEKLKEIEEEHKNLNGELRKENKELKERIGYAIATMQKMFLDGYDEAIEDLKIKKEYEKIKKVLKGE